MEERSYVKKIKLPNIPRIQEKIPVHPDIPAFSHLRMKVVDVMHTEGGEIIVTTILNGNRPEFLKNLKANLTTRYGYKEES